MYNNARPAIPRSLKLSDDGVELLQGKEWVPHYHKFKNDPSIKSLIEWRLETNEIVKFDGEYDIVPPSFNIIKVSTFNNDLQPRRWLVILR
jgi:hypothetical protein